MIWEICPNFCPTLKNALYDFSIQPWFDGIFPISESWIWHKQYWISPQIQEGWGSWISFNALKAFTKNFHSLWRRQIRRTLDAIFLTIREKKKNESLLSTRFAWLCLCIIISHTVNFWEAFVAAWSFVESWRGHLGVNARQCIIICISQSSWRDSEKPKHNWNENLCKSENFG